MKKNTKKTAKTYNHKKHQKTKQKTKRDVISNILTRYIWHIKVKSQLCSKDRYFLIGKKILVYIKQPICLIARKIQIIKLSFTKTPRNHHIQHNTNPQIIP